MRYPTGTEAALDALVSRVQVDFAVMTSALNVFRMDEKHRDEVSKMLAPPSNLRVCPFPSPRVLRVVLTMENQA